jgi:hypothetical protein
MEMEQRGHLSSSDIQLEKDLPDQPVIDAPIGGDRGAQDGPISERTGRNPGNLGDDVPSGADTTYPAPDIASEPSTGPAEM